MVSRSPTPLIATLVGLLLLGGLGSGVVLSRSMQGIPPGESPALPDEKPTPAAPAEEEATSPVVDEPDPDDAEEAQETVVLFQSLTGDDLRRKLHEYSKDDHSELTYRRAREIMYWQSDNDGGVVTTIYARRATSLPPGEWPDPRVLNCEHLWPQSKGAKRPPMRTDLYHLRPAVPRVNSIRSNHPFGDPVPPYRHDDGWRAGRDSADSMCFQPPPTVRGDVSRSLFYFSIRYEAPIDDSQELILRKWDEEDPVDDIERRRAEVIEEEQGNRNPFIIDSTIVDRIEDF